jgi:hypothetical protein
MQVVFGYSEITLLDHCVKYDGDVSSDDKVCIEVDWIRREDEYEMLSHIMIKEKI